jgi:hypothetical protein
MSVRRNVDGTDRAQPGNVAAPQTLCRASGDNCNQA